MTTPSFTVCVLGFADCTKQLGRCLDSILGHLPSPHVAEVRIGLNTPSEALTRLAFDRADRAEGARVAVRLHGSTRSPAKYPMMRRLFYDRPIDTPFVMWFDDDSWIRADYRGNFFADHAATMEAGFDLVGARYTIGLRPGQPEWIARQPWARHAEAYRAGQPVAFFQGAWWVARAQLLRDHDYPWPELHHNGGDVMLGVLAQARGWNTWSTRQGVAINADDDGRESRGPRRGLDTPPIGALEAARCS